MAAITATYVFNPAVTGGSITVSGNAESEVKEAVKTVLNQRLTTQQATIAPIQNALTEMDQ